MTQRGILAFSGGLDTSVVVKYLQEEHDMDVITVTVDVGQGDDAKKIALKCKKIRSKKMDKFSQAFEADTGKILNIVHFIKKNIA